MSGPIRLSTPLKDEEIAKLNIGDLVLLNGVAYTARDAAHQCILKTLREGGELPFDPAGQVIYYVGPAPEPPGRVIGSAGPTTAGRMDPYTPELLRLGLKGMVGKGQRSREVIQSMVEFRAVYFTAVGGAAALLSEKIKESRVIAYPELGPEAIRQIVFEDFPAIVANDIYGGDLFKTGWKRYRRQKKHKTV
ncbi:MAG: Fe-S-containing hydro-lyase [Deltaproteobacteria bacterium]|nr:Fe-S-containing hydro-lyase [Deltaproteobacteria bacterium]